MATKKTTGDRPRSGTTRTGSAPAGRATGGTKKPAGGRPPVRRKAEEDAVEAPRRATRPGVSRTGPAATAAAGRAGRTAVARAGGPTRPRIKSSHDAPSRTSHERPSADRPRPSAGADPRRTTPRTRATASEIAHSAAPARATEAQRGAKPAGPASRRAPGRSTPPPAPSSATRELALSIAGAALDKKALHVEVLDVTGRVDYTDFLVVMTGTSDRHVASIAQGIDEELSRKKIQALSIEGLSQATWVLLDYGDVVAHVFQEETRSVYDIEGLWLDARKVQLPAPGSEGGPPPSAGRRPS